jgi:Mg2+/citrate symporter
VRGHSANVEGAGTRRKRGRVVGQAVTANVALLTGDGAGGFTITYLAATPNAARVAVGDRTMMAATTWSWATRNAR